MKAKQVPALFSLLCAAMGVLASSCVTSDPGETEASDEAGETDHEPSSAPYALIDANGVQVGVMETGPDDLDGSLDVFAALGVDELVLRRPDGLAFGLDVDGAVFGLLTIPADQELYFGTIACAGPAARLATVAGDQPTAQTCPSVDLELGAVEAGPLVLLSWDAQPGEFWGVDVDALEPAWMDVGSIRGPDGACFDTPALAGCLVNLGANYPIPAQLEGPFTAVSL